MSTYSVTTTSTTIRRYIVTAECQNHVYNAFMEDWAVPDAWVLDDVDEPYGEELNYIDIVKKSP